MVGSPLHFNCNTDCFFQDMGWYWAASLPNIGRWQMALLKA